MITIENISVIKETEKAMLLKAFITELEKEVEFWLPKSKIELNNNTLKIDKEVWNEKLEELKTPPEQESIIIYVAKYEELEKSIKLILSSKLKKIELTPWVFIPKSLIIEQMEMDT